MQASTADLDVAAARLGVSRRRLRFIASIMLLLMSATSALISGGVTPLLGAISSRGFWLGIVARRRHRVALGVIDLSISAHAKHRRRAREILGENSARSAARSLSAASFAYCALTGRSALHFISSSAHVWRRSCASVMHANKKQNVTIAEDRSAARAQHKHGR